MTQQNKAVYVFECPADVDDRMPLAQIVKQLDSRLPIRSVKGKTVLPLLWKIDPDVPDFLMGDTMRLTQIVLNLCSNAVKVGKKTEIKEGKGCLIRRGESLNLSACRQKRIDTSGSLQSTVVFGYGYDGMCLPLP